jgi:hypothetical protein
MRLPAFIPFRSQAALAEFLFGVTLALFGMLMVLSDSCQRSQHHQVPAERPIESPSEPQTHGHPQHRARPPPPFEAFRWCDRSGGDPRNGRS